MNTTAHLLLAAALLTAPAAFAHGPAFDCYLEGAGGVKCEAGFTDGSSAAGRTIQVRDSRGKVLLEGPVAADGSYRFQAPSGDYAVTFLGGDGHDATLQSFDITQ
ncbi:hypothetical protein [Pseudomonas cremoricolorata]|uniref:Carboxypeptidase regulatory-like domain-containing protein n=1 Tax=Pseudomonas cremoricolorata TaxID=157783 RepID=A0A089WQB5_9PSED|nr:hypothetical protein [Pseudomonas cremoricolorata]AIR91495.1 hypothetical protein LK03_20480 [Pseudomonas cremoricolorata]